MKTRAITALFFVIVMLASFYGGEALFLGFYTILAIACLFEFYGLFDQRISALNRWVGLLGGLWGMGLLAFTNLGILSEKWLWTLVLLGPLVFYIELSERKKHPFDAISIVFLGWIYALLPFYSYMQLAWVNGAFETYLPLGFLLILWASDTGAYLSGKALGKHKLFERISPKKTWEGFGGGILLAQLAAYLWAGYTPSQGYLLWAIIALVIAIGGTYGDLVESMLKRSLHKKDSGSLLPGHGGLLDRFDGLLLAAPLVYIALKFLTY